MQNSLNLQQEAKVELAKRELARRKFEYYAPYMYTDYMENWHTKLICQALDKVVDGEIRFLIIEAPPRHSKSIHVSQLFPSFIVGKNPDHSVIVSSYSGDLATDHGRETRNLIKGKKYQNTFNTKLSPDSDSKSKWNTQKLDAKGKEWINAKGAYNAAGVGGSITGRGADVLIIDDPLKDREEADSEVIREARWKWLRSVARTRLSPKGAMVIMHTRWHEDDMIGRITDGEKTKESWIDYFDFLERGLDGNKWVRLTLKAIAEEDEAMRKKGEALWPKRYNLEELSDIKNSLGPYEWSALYQQEPVDDESREFKQAWFKQSTFEKLERMKTRKFATIDTALKAKEGADYTGVTRCWTTENEDWYVNGRRYRLDSRGIIDLVFMLHDEGFEVIGIEEGAWLLAVKPFFDEECKTRGVFPRVTTLKHNQVMKEVRIRGLVPRYTVGKIWHIESPDLEKELLAFPKGANDDVADSTSYLPQIIRYPKSQLYKQAQSRRRTNIGV